MEYCQHLDLLMLLTMCIHISVVCKDLAGLQCSSHFPQTLHPQANGVLPLAHECQLAMAVQTCKQSIRLTPHAPPHAPHTPPSHSSHSSSCSSHTSGSVVCYQICLHIFFQSEKKCYKAIETVYDNQPQQIELQLRPDCYGNGCQL